MTLCCAMCMGPSSGLGIVMSGRNCKAAVKWLFLGIQIRRRAAESGRAVSTRSGFIGSVIRSNYCLRATTIAISQIRN
jgi:hypothetical protein